MDLTNLLDNTLYRIFPILHQLEKKPKIIIRKEVVENGNFLNSSDKLYGGKQYTDYEVDCIFVQEPEVIYANNQPIVIKKDVFYILREKLDFKVTLNDRIIFNNREYKPTSLMTIFPYLKITAEKISI